MMARKKKDSVNEEVVKLEKINNKKTNIVSEGFYYVFSVVLSLVLIFATEELLSAINYLFVVVFAILAVVQIISFIMGKEYEKGNYSNLFSSVVCLWIALFVFQYGDFLFLEMLPVLLSLLLFLMAISSLTKYFDYKRKGNLIVAIISVILGISLIFVSRSIMYVFFKITGFYLLLIVILDLLDYLKNKNKN